MPRNDPPESPRGGSDGAPPGLSIEKGPASPARLVPPAVKLTSSRPRLALVSDNAPAPVAEPAPAVGPAAVTRYLDRLVRCHDVAKDVHVLVCMALDASLESGELVYRQGSGHLAGLTGLTGAAIDSAMRRLRRAGFVTPVRDPLDPFDPEYGHRLILPAKAGRGRS